MKHLCLKITLLNVQNIHLQTSGKVQLYKCFLW